MMERTISFIRSKLPRRLKNYSRFRAEQTDPGSLEDVFAAIYRNNSWRNQESVSGRGSTLERTCFLRETLPVLLKDLNCTSLVDAACGDFNWMRHVCLGGIQYLGIDIVPDLICRNTQLYANPNRRFIAMDITLDPLPPAGVIICRDCFIHLSFKDIHDAIVNIKASKAAYLLATTHTGVEENAEIRSGEWRSINLQLPPFNFPSPIRLITEDPIAGKCLGVWDLSGL